MAQVCEATANQAGRAGLRRPTRSVSPQLQGAFQERPIKLDLFAACSGARTEHIDKRNQVHSKKRYEQLDQAQSIKPLPESVPTPDLVSITIGGNDAGGEPDSRGNGGIGKTLRACYLKAHSCQKDKKFVGKIYRVSLRFAATCPVRSARSGAPPPKR